MARCESVDVQRDIILDSLVQDMENSESDSDGDSSCIIVDMDMNREQKENHLDSLEEVNEKQVNVGPVLSLQCLHEDSADEAEECRGNAAKSKFQFINADDVPELTVNSGQDDNEDLNKEPEEGEEHPHLVPLTIVVANGSSSDISISRPHSSVPARNNWDGTHNFKIKVQCTDVPRKSENLVYSEPQNKFYVAKDYPFKVLVNAENVPAGSMIKVTAVFSLVEHSLEMVQRCPTHAQHDYSKGNPAFEHFVQCFSKTAVYEKDKSTGKLSVSVPYENPQEGETYTKYPFKLTCFSSCSGGINRRPFMLVFTLEKDNIPLGRQTLEAKVCACPLRDFKLHEERRHKRKFKTDKTPNNEETHITSSGEKIPTKYSISVKDPELYQFLMQMKCLYETYAYATKAKPDT